MKIGRQLRKKETKNASGTKKLQSKEGLDPISLRPPLEQTVEPSVCGREAFPSRAMVLNQVMDALNDPNLHMIGIFGMGGIGKTTLAKEVLRKAVEDMLFDSVVMVAVSQTPELRRIQGEIADFLGLKFDTEDVPGRASLLYERLKNSKVLIILDDIWAKLDLKSVGIPFGNKGKGGKILLTSRSKDVLCREMGTQKDFLVELLCENEACRLFEMTLADAKDSQLQAIAPEIAKNCAGLPLLILIVATYFRNKESYVSQWHNMLKELPVFNHEEMVKKVLRSIYHNLPGKEVKSFFLLCALCGSSNIWIENLVRYSLGLGMLKDISTIQEARDRVLRWISKLKDGCLLLDSDKKGCVAMHDVVRETALSIAYEVQNAFVGRSGVRLWEWPSKDCTRISLPLCDIDCLAQGLECPEAEFFLLLTEDCCLEIPDSFFKGTRKLKVVDLTGIRFARQLPSSLGFLTNLQTLCLEGCQLDDITIVGELKQLECLSFSRSNIVELPREINQLRQLKLLDLSKCSQLEVIPANVLSKLFLLEELYMGGSFVGWDEKGKARVMELDELSHLTTLEIQVKNAEKIPDCLFSKELLRYTILMGDEWDCYRIYKMENLECIWHTSQLTANSFGKLKSLTISSCENLLVVFSSNVVREFRRLEHLDIRNCPKIEEIYQLGELNSTELVAFELRHLYIRSMASLKRIWRSEDGDGKFSFQNLKSVEASFCDKLEYVFPESIACDLLQMEKLYIWHCEVEHIIGKPKSVEADDEDEAPRFFYFPELTFLQLENLRELRSFYPKAHISDWPKLKYLRVDKCDKATRLGVKVSSNLKTLMFDCKNSIEFSNEGSFGLKVIELSHLKDGFPLGFLKRLYSLEKFVLTFCSLERVESILFDDETSVAEEENVITILPLKYLKVECCDRLKYIAQSSISFQNLTALHVSLCGNMKNLVTTSTAKTMIHLMELTITYCDKMKEIITNDGDDTEHEIIFSHLKHLELQHLPTLYSFCSGKCIFHFPLLEQVIVKQCLQMKIFCGGILDTPKLKAVQDWKYRKYDSSGESEEEVQYWERNLNATIASRYFRERALQNAYRWCVVEDPSSSKAILGNQLQFLNKLRYFFVRDCDSIQVVFDLKDEDVERWRSGLLPKLEELQLINLPKLSEIWNEDPVLMFDFKMLRLLKVQNCSNLKYAFTQSMISSLSELQVIEVENCKMMEAIIKGEEAEETELFNTRFTSMKKISIKGCPSMKELMSPALSREQNPRPDKEENEIAMPVLKELRIDWNIIKHNLKGNNQPDFFSGLKVIELVFPSNNFSTMEKLVLRDSSVEEIIFNGLDNHHELLLQLRKVILSKLPNLKHLVYDNDPRRASIFQNLQVLHVWECSRLETLVPSFVYFQNLTFLHVSTCNGMINLITVSTAKSLVQLKTIYVGRCKKLEQIVAAESDGEGDQIGFPQLEYLVLDDLPCLTSFCSSKNTFDFSSLEEVFVIKCPKLKTFAIAINTPKLSQVQTGGKEYEWEWEGSLSSTIQVLAMERKK